jgi:predicted transcriptional regulator of viral defense system
MSTPNELPFKKKFVSIDELKALGLSYYKINKLIQAGKLKKLTRRNYENLTYQGAESDFFYVPAYIPKGVICLTSAAVYWQLSTERPAVLDVAVPRKTKLYTIPEWPRFQCFYFDEKRYSLGKINVHEDLNSFAIYDIEKTVVDTLSYREKLGTDMAKEVLIQYLKTAHPNLNKLHRYAVELNTDEILRTYLEVLL